MNNKALQKLIEEVNSPLIQFNKSTGFPLEITVWIQEHMENAFKAGALAHAEATKIREEDKIWCRCVQTCDEHDQRSTIWYYQKLSKAFFKSLNNTHL